MEQPVPLHLSSDDLIRGRLLQLRAELRTGEEEMDALQVRRAALRDTMLRISGAIQVLEQIVGNETPAHTNDPPRRTDSP